jgi:rhodanese-related sulfurtransferase
MLLKRILTILLSISLIFIMACSDDDSPTEPEVNEFNLLTAAGDDYFTNYTTPSGVSPNMSISDLFTLLTDGDATNDPYMIDFRAASAYADGHITGSINMSIGSLVDNLDNLPTDRLIVNICYTGQNASVATATLNMMGYEARNLLFGMCGVNTGEGIEGTDKWPNQIAADEYTLNMVDAGDPPSRTGFPDVNTGKTNATEIMKDRFSLVTAGWGVSFSDLLANKDDYFIVNYWSYDDYMNIGHIEGAYQFTPKVDMQKDQLLELLPTDQKIAVYCWTGQTSAQLTAYLRMLGYDAYSVLYGVNGFAYGSLSSHKYTEPTNDYTSIITQ